MSKTLLVGLDAACWEYVNPLLDSGRLPVLRQLMDSGVWGTLQSTIPALTPVAWASISTGKNPGKHGIFDMTWRSPGTYEFVPTNAHLRWGTPFWKRLNDQGLRVGLVNIPFTYPPEPIDGFVVTGFGTPHSVLDFAYPSDALEWINACYGNYQPQVAGKFLAKASPSEILEAELKVQAQQVDVAIDLAARYQVNTLAINLMSLDHANHKMPSMDQVQEAICHSDTELDRLLQGFQPDNVMLISDHGSRRVKGDFLLQAWLRDKGYTVQIRRTPSEQLAALNWVLKQWFKVRGGNGNFLQKKMLRYLTKHMIFWLPERLTYRLWNEIDKSIPFACEHIQLSDEIDYAHSQVFLGAQYSGLIYLNLAERDPTGLISREEKIALSSRLIEELKQIMDPELGEPLFSGVYRAKELYAGSAVQDAPDIIIDSYNARWNISSTFRRGARVENVYNRYFVDNVRDFGHHSRDGIFVFHGDDFKNTGHILENKHVTDIPATLLYLHNVPIPEDYDGSVLKDMLSPKFVSQHPLNYQVGDTEYNVSAGDLYSPEETEELLGHLRALGYVD